MIIYNFYRNPYAETVSKVIKVAQDGDEINILLGIYTAYYNTEELVPYNLSIIDHKIIVAIN